MSGSFPGGALGALIDGLFQASFAGIEFHMPDARSEAGRRVIGFLFPGRDGLAHEDLGAAPRRITISGLVLGEDHVRRARRLEAAFLRPGPATLVHPWLGEIEVVLVQPASFTFTERELRVVRFDAVFERVVAPASPLDTLGRLLDAADGLRDAARGLLRRVLAPVRLGLGAIAAVSAYLGSAATTWRTVLAGVRGGATLRGALAGPVEALEGFSFAPVATAGDDTADVLGAVPAAAARAAAPAAIPAIGPGPAAPAAPAPADRRAAALLLIDAAAGLGAGPAEAAAPRLAARAQALAEAARTIADIPFESRQEARAWRARQDAALGAGVTAAAALGATEPEAAGQLLRALVALRAAAAADLDERIGRLPEVLLLAAPPGGGSAWQVAQHIAGDDPAAVVAAHADIVARNRLRHPALIPGGQVLEILP
jgi:prophage DNA circulation protein